MRNGRIGFALLLACFVVFTVSLATTSGCIKQVDFFRRCPCRECQSIEHSQKPALQQLQAEQSPKDQQK